MTERYRPTEIINPYERDPVTRRRAQAIKALESRYAGIPG